jgi:hydroxymethylpyrimidine/phosphomethylpyrimidine kinase
MQHPQRREFMGASYPVVLLVGGTDPSGGAGLAADIKAAAAAGVHGMIAVTATTVQNSGRVHSWRQVPPGDVAAQIRAAVEDGLPGAVKSGMLGSTGMVETLRELLESDLRGVRYVLDPVLAAGSGDALHTGGMADAARRLLLPLATLATPNLDEAEAFTGMRVRDPAGMETAARCILDMGPGAVLLKGGHLVGEPRDYLATRDGGTWFPGWRTVPGKVHGTGCTLASAAAARLASGMGVRQAVEGALAYLRQSISSAFVRVHGVIPGHLPPVGPMPDRSDGEAFYLAPRFCSRCGGVMYIPAGSGHPACAACGFVGYRNPLPAVTLVVRRGGRVLLVRRAVAPHRGMLCLPGGFLELGETVEECASRELAEETGLSADGFRLVSVETDDTAYGGVILAVLEAAGCSGEAVAGDDAGEICWVAPAEAPKLAFRAHDRIVSELASGGRAAPVSSGGDEG